MSAAEKPKSRRDNFTKSVIEILYKRAGGRCCRCSAATFGPVTNDLSKYRNIGQAAHIAAAAPGGPRYNARMSPEERTSASNGLWLCSNCHDVIDRDVAEFTTSVLRKLKKDGEEKAKREIGVATRGVSPSKRGTEQYGRRVWPLCSRRREGDRRPCILVWMASLAFLSLPRPRPL